VDVVEANHKFIAAKTTDLIAGPQAKFEAVGNFNEQVIARRMAEPIVGRFEVI
jgi:hypothetical protein